MAPNSPTEGQPNFARMLTQVPLWVTLASARDLEADFLSKEAHSVLTAKLDKDLSEASNMSLFSSL